MTQMVYTIALFLYNSKCGMTIKFKNVFFLKNKNIENINKTLIIHTIQLKIFHIFFL